MFINKLASLILGLGFLLALPSYGHEVRPAHVSLAESSAGQWSATFRQPQVDRRYLKLSLSTNCQQEETDLKLDDNALQAIYLLDCGDAGLTSIEIVGLERTLIDTLVSIKPLQGNSKTLLLSPRAPRAKLASAALPAYLSLGLEHLWYGLDHLVFIMMLLYLVRGWANLLKVITSFTVAHSITLGISATGLIQISQGPVEALIALSILLLALEVLKQNSPEVQPSLLQRWPWLLTFIFGLLHGLGFAGALKDIGLPEDNQLVALLLFNLGIELGQLSVVLIALIMVRLYLRVLPASPPWLNNLPVYLAGGLAAWWFVARSLEVMFL